MKFKGMELNGDYKVVFDKDAIFVYDSNDYLIYWENSKGDWEKSTFDSKGNETSYETSTDIITNKWKPENGDEYYTIDFTDEKLTWRQPWFNDLIDKKLLELGLVFKTREEAAEAVKKMLDALEEE